MDLLQYVPQQMLILIAGAYIIGLFLKRTPKVKDWSIVWIILVICVSGSIGMNVVGKAVTGETFTIAISQGIICAGVAVLGDQLKKQNPQRDSQEE